MGKVLITGGAGFIGLHVANKFAQNGFKVHLVDNLTRGVKDEDLSKSVRQYNHELFAADLLDRRGMDSLENDYEYMLHFAALLGVANVLNNPHRTLRCNVEMTFNAIEFAKRQKSLKQFVFASTSEVYAGTLRYHGLVFPTPESTPLTVNDLGHPRTSYMLSKIYGEALTAQSDLPFVVIRPHNVYGPRMGLSHVVPELLKKAHLANEWDELPVYSMEHKRTFCYIDDAVEMIYRATTYGSALGETLNVGTQEPEVTIGELVQVILQATGKIMKLVPMPETPGSPARRCPDMSRMYTKCGYSSLIGLAEGVTRTYQWYKERVFEGGGVSAA